MTTYSLRVLEKTEDGGVIVFRCADYDAAVMTSSASGVDGPASGGMGGVVATQFLMLDIPLLSQEDDSPGVYVAAAPLAGSWRGAVLYRSRDEGTTYTEALRLSVAATLGRCESVIGDWTGGNQVDVSSTLDVHIFGELSTITAAQLLDGGNRALIGGEVVHFRRADLLSAGRYRLSGFLRGRLGTEGHIDTHAAGERFVMLDAGVRRLPEQFADRGKTMFYRCVTLGDQVTQGQVQVLEPLRFVSLLPLSPIELSIVPIESGGQSVRWVRRTRYPAPLVDGSDAPVGEASEVHSLRIENGGIGTTVSEEFSAETTATSYTLADGYENRSLQISQVSALVGRGAVASITTGI